MKKPKRALIKEPKKWRYIPHSWIGRFNTVKMSVLLSLLYGSNSIPTKFPARYFVDIDTLILKFIWTGKRPRTNTTILKDRKDWEDYPISRLTIKLM